MLTIYFYILSPKFILLQLLRETSVISITSHFIFSFIKVYIELWFAELADTANIYKLHSVIQYTLSKITFIDSTIDHIRKLMH